MKKSLFLLSFVWFSMFVFSQAPLGINYQTVIRDSDGQSLPNTELTLKMTIRSGALDGEAVYVETHAVVSNAFGLVNLMIGQGTPLRSEFATIAWGKNAFYLETAVDLTGGGQFQVLGVTQFLSVPYSMYSGQSGGMLSMTTQERNSLENPSVGMQIYNLTTNCLNYYSGNDWYETCGTMVVNQPPFIPMNPAPYDGAIEMPFDLTLGWACTDPDYDPLTFDLYFGNLNPPGLYQSGIIDFEFPLSQLDFSMIYYWKIEAHDTNGNIAEGPLWSFTTMMCMPPTPWAGNDATICEGSSHQIEAATGGPGIYQVQWSTNGDGTFSNPATENPIYTPGLIDITNGFVELTITGFAAQPCPPFPGSDVMFLTIQSEPTVFAGPDQTVCFGVEVQLDGEAENYSLIMWSTNGSGDFQNNGTEEPIYLPSISDYIAGCIILRMDAVPVVPCTLYKADSLNLCISPFPEANAGTNQMNLPGTNATLGGNIPPSGGYGLWSIISGSGGSIAQPNNPSSIFTGLASHSYLLLWTVYDQYGCNSEDDVAISFTSSLTCEQNFTDIRDGKVYSSVQIGTQCWMAQNLNIGTLLPGTSSQTNNGIIEKYCYEDTELNCEVYGGLYQWNEMMEYFTTQGIQGICPTGWHLPTNAEWTVLTNYLGGEGVAGGKMKETGTTHWKSPNTGSTNSSGFTALPDGYRSTGGIFSYKSIYGYFWTSTAYFSADAIIRLMSYNNAFTNSNYYTKSYGFSVRCLKN
jgi:uncharacterized protein (TIGR02145 family)